jgi:hypothetical protein
LLLVVFVDEKSVVSENVESATHYVGFVSYFEQFTFFDHDGVFWNDATSEVLD